MIATRSQVLASAVAVASAGLAHGATLTDTFDYPDQAAFEAAYTIEASEGSAATLDLSGGASDVDFTVAAGSSNSVRITSNAGPFALTADSPASVGVTTVDGEGFDLFGRGRIGLSSASTPGSEFYLQLEGRNANSDRFRLVVKSGGNSETVAEVNLPSQDRIGDFLLTIDGGNLSVLRNGSAITELTDIASGVDFSEYATGADAFFELRNASNNPRGVTIDNLSIDASPVPEPGSLALAGVGVFVLLRRRR